ncbi:MAG: GldG family protein [Proteobacteria bacterium]|jgi:gliding-associated putative ABC transporter substrate-binding component GldG|nr:GldG family protein [Pseudomonadota bacterium]
MREKTKLKSQSTVFLLVLLGILVLVNVLGVRFFGRADLTRDDVFTLSGASISLMEQLDDKLVVKAYFTKNLPGRFASLERNVRDVLEEYRQHSGGRMTVEFLDPTGDEEEEATAKSLGIQKMPNPDIEKDQTTIKEGYRGISLSYGQETEAIRAVDSAVGLEYLITTTIKKAVGRKSTIGFLVGHGEPEVEPPPEDPKRPLLPEEKKNRGAYRNIRNNLEIYNYRQVDLKKGEVDVPPDVDALVIVGASQPLDDKELYRLDQFLLRGGSLAVILSGVDVVGKQQQDLPMLPPTYETKVNGSRLRELLGAYGVELGSALVFDSQAASFSAQCPPLPLPLPRPYPAWPVVTAFDDEHPVTFRLGSLTMTYATEVRVSKEAAADKARNAAELAFSSGSSWTVGGDSAIVDPCGIAEPPNLESGLPVAAAISGRFRSYFQGEKAPVEPKPDAGPEGRRLKESLEPGRLIVIGTSGLPLDESLMYIARADQRRAANNFMFMQNALDWMTNEDDLIAVRMKTVNDPPIERGEESAKAIAKWGNIVGVPLLFILFGVVRWRIRVRRRPTKEAKPNA